MASSRRRGRAAPDAESGGLLAHGDSDDESKADGESPRFLMAMGVFVCLMILCAVAAALRDPQAGRQHEWLSVQGVQKAYAGFAPEAAAAAGAADVAAAAVADAAAAVDVAPAADAAADAVEAPPEKPLAQKPLQQVPGLPAGPEKAAAEPAGSATRVVCATTAGPLTMDVYDSWAPLGAKQFLHMVTHGFFSSRVGLFRSVKNFLCQTGVAGNPAVTKQWRSAGTIRDDPQWLEVGGANKPMKRGYVSFAGGGQDSRGTEFFFAFRDLRLGGSPWEVPFGKLVGDASFAALDRFYSGYGDMVAFGGHAPQQGQIYKRGAAYLDEDFPLLDFITGCDVVDWGS